MRELDIQKKLLKMKDEELQISSKTIFNSAQNPSITPSTASTDELPYINAQNTTNHRRSQMDAWSAFTQLLNPNLTQEFVKKFDKLFTIVLKTNKPLWYTTNEGDYTI